MQVHRKSHCHIHNYIHSGKGFKSFEEHGKMFLTLNIKHACKSNGKESDFVRLVLQTSYPITEKLVVAAVAFTGKGQVESTRWDQSIILEGTTLKTVG